MTDSNFSETELLRLASIVESSNDYIISEDFNGTILSWNKAAERILGFTAEEAVGQHISIILTPELLADEAGMMQKIKNGELIEHYETHKLRKNGSLVPISLTASPIKNAAGELVGISKIGRDISERKQSEKQLREAVENYEALVKSTSLAIWNTDEQGRVVTPAEWWIDLTGQQFDSTEQNWLDYVHPDDRAKTVEAWHSALTNKHMFNTEYRIRTINQNYRHFSVCGVPVFSEDGSFRQWIGTFADISERKGVEEALSISEQRLRSLIDNLFSFVGLLTPDGILIEINRTSLAVADLKAEEVIGKPLADSYWWSWSEECQQTLRQSIARAANGETMRFDAVVRVGENEFITIDFQIAPIISENGEITHLVPSAIDITERLRLEASISRSAQMSLASELAANLAHEIKNPLTGIKGAIDLLTETQTAKKADYPILELVKKEITRIDESVKLLLNRVKTRPMCFEQASLTDTMHHVVQLAHHHIMAGNSGNRIKIVTSIPQEKLILPHDSAQMTDAVLNLIINAADAIGDQPGCVGIVLYQAQTDGVREYIIEVSDTGSGIPPNDLPYIFMPFFTTKNIGTGLGLAAVRRIAESHRGRCKVQSTTGQGSTFKIHLPVIPPIEIILGSN